MTLANAFTIAWKDLKTGASKVATFLTKNQKTIETVVADAGTVAAAVDPALAPVVTEFDHACSRFRPDSELMAVNRGEGTPVAVGPVLTEAVTAALRAAAAIESSFTIVS